MRLRTVVKMPLSACNFATLRRADHVGLGGRIHMPRVNDAAGMAALTITETILLMLIEKGLLKAEDVGIALEDTVQIHRDSASSSACEMTRASHLAAARLAENLLHGSNLQAATRFIPAQ
jgi:hypothetical protein